MIVMLWRGGLRVQEALALSERDLDPRRGSVLVRHGKGRRRREVGMDAWGWENLRPWLSERLELPACPLFCVIDGPTRGRPWSAAAGLCPRVNQSEEKDRRGPLTKHGPTYLRWALLEATMHALRHPAYAERYQRTKRRLGKQRGAKLAQVDIARRLAHAIWHMLSRKEKFAPRGAALRLAA